MADTRISYLRLRRRAQQLLENQVGPPVDLKLVADVVDAEIRYLDLKDDISGILYRQKDHRVIVVNKNHAPARQRFSIAHEVGHLALHRGEEVHVDQGFRINLRDPRSATAEDAEEIEANAFAANLLMPSAWLHRDVKDETLDLADETEIKRLAERYGVSKQAMIFRLAALFSDR